jgi:hypothetical protein
MSAAPPLEELQRGLQGFVLGEANGIAAAIAAGPGPDAGQRLGIYRFAYCARLADALRDGYGHTATYLGADAFDNLARTYIASHPPRRGNLRWYGDDFAPWLALRHPAVPEVAELAALDWALRCAFDGADAPALDAGRLAAIPPESWSRVRLSLHPTTQRLRLNHNTVALWHAIDTEATPPRSLRLPEAVELLVWRRDLQPNFRSLGTLEAAALDHALRGHTFGATCEALAAAYPQLDIACEAGALLRRWIDEALLADVALAEG